jgi:hypothetical protein
VRTMKQIALALGAFVLGVLGTVAAIVGAFSLPDWIADIFGMCLLWPWWVIAKYGTRMLPDSVTGPYDPVGHPALHVVGVGVNAVYLVGLCYLAYLLVRAWRVRVGKNTA